MKKRNIFQTVKVAAPPRSKFDLSHERKLTCDMGKLVPIYLDEILPGDSYRVNTQIFLRFQALLAPIMHRVNVRLDFFFVPWRIIWDEFEDWVTGGPQGTSAPLAPFWNLNTTNRDMLGIGLLGDYFGLPLTESFPTIDPATNQKISSLPWRAYATIYNEYYIDQNVGTPLTVPKTSGSDDATIHDLAFVMERAWEKDYFTSCLPWAQRGAAVGLPFGNASVTYMPNSQLKLTGTGANVPANRMLGISPSGAAGSMESGAIATMGSAATIRVENIDSIALSGTINDLRRSLRLQEWLEKSAVGGSRYVEQNRVHFGAKSSDARLQRPEYLGGGTSAVQISEVLSTLQQVDPSTDLPVGNPQATMAGKGTAFSNAGGFRRSFEEHGYVMGIMSILPKTGYQQGIPKLFQRFDKFDLAWPEFAHIGEQAVLNRELYFTGQAGTTPNGTFGYQSRYAEYKYKPNQSSGEMRDNYDYWNMDRIFTSQPALNEEFIKSDPTTRIFAVADTAFSSCIVQCYHKVDALRPLPYYGTPML